MVTTEQIYWIIGIASWVWISFLLIVLTFTFYVAIMKMREMQAMIFNLHPLIRWLCLLILVVGLILDVLLNWIYCTVAFLEFPREFLTTERIRRHKYFSLGWRQKQALWYCENLLTPFDSDHCK